MSNSGKRASVAGALVAALAAAYFLGGVRSPESVVAAPSQPKTAVQAQQSGAQAQVQPASPVAPIAGPATNTVSVGGIGRIAGTPDTLQLQLSVESRGADVSKALDGASTALQKVSASLKSNGVAAADLKTSGLGVQANYNYENKGENGAPTLIDYVATESLTVKLRDLDKAGAAISAAVTAGGNAVRVNGASLDLEGNSGLVKSARDAAFADAKAKAEQYAQLAGRALGPVSTISENVTDSPPVPVNQAFATADAAVRQSVPIERGSQEVAVNVQVTWLLQ